MKVKAATLPEVLVSITILSIIFGIAAMAISNSLVTGESYNEIILKNSANQLLEAFKQGLPENAIELEDQVNFEYIKTEIGNNVLLLEIEVERYGETYISKHYVNQN